MKKLIVVLMLSLFVIVSSGCYHITYDSGKQIPANITKTKLSANMFLWGIVGTTIDIKKLACKEIMKIESKESFVDWLLGYITLGIYVPNTVLVYCIK